MARKPSKATTSASKRLRKGDSVAALALSERGFIKRLKKRCAGKRSVGRRGRKRS